MDYFLFCRSSSGLSLGHWICSPVVAGSILRRCGFFSHWFWTLSLFAICRSSLISKSIMISNRCETSNKQPKRKSYGELPLKLSYHQEKAVIVTISLYYQYVDLHSYHFGDIILGPQKVVWTSEAKLYPHALDRRYTWRNQKINCKNVR